MLYKFLTMLAIIGSAHVSIARDLDANGNEVATYEIRSLFDEKRELTKQIEEIDIKIEAQEEIQNQREEDNIFVKQHLNQKERTVKYKFNITFDRYYQNLASEIDQLKTDEEIAQKQKQIIKELRAAKAALEVLEKERDTLQTQLDWVTARLNALTGRLNYR